LEIIIFWIIGTISFFRSANSNTINNKKKPATAKNPAAILLNKVPNHHPSPKPIKKRKKNPKKNAVMPITIPAVAVDAPRTALAFANWVKVFT